MRIGGVGVWHLIGGQVGVVSASKGAVWTDCPREFGTTPPSSPHHVPRGSQKLIDQTPSRRNPKAIWAIWVLPVLGAKGASEILGTPLQMNMEPPNHRGCKGKWSFIVFPWSILRFHVSLQGGLRPRPHQLQAAEFWELGLGEPIPLSPLATGRARSTAPPGAVGAVGGGLGAVG